MAYYYNGKNYRRRRRKNPAKPILIGTVAVIIIALIIALSMRGSGNPSDMAASNPVNLPSAAPTESAAPAQPATQPPAAELTPEPTHGVNIVDSGVLSRPLADEGFLPVFFRARYQTEKVIAITVDDCFQYKNARDIIDLALAVDGKITLFPIGENTLNLKETLTYAYENGMEIENHTYSHNGLYGDTDEELTQHIYLADAALDSILGVDYQMHFLRPRGGDDRNDQRTHTYLRQLGYYGIVHWTNSGSSEDIAKLIEEVAPGKIYLFHTTDNDLARLQQFIPAVTEMGYKLVTLNEMFGYPDNEVSPLTKTEEELKVVPTIAPYEEILIDLSKGDYSYSVKKMQQRLIDLGWLTGQADGEYGKNTYNAVGYFQQAAGIKATGQADVATQQALYADTAPKKG